MKPIGMFLGAAGALIGVGFLLGRSVDQVSQAQARGSEQAGSTAGAEDNYPLGRKAAPIVDGQYPASYFPNT
jgi:hypothetical protein